LQQQVENGAQLAVEAQRAVAHVLGGGALLRGERSLAGQQALQSLVEISPGQDLGNRRAGEAL